MSIHDATSSDTKQNSTLKNALKILPFFFRPHAREMGILFFLGLAYAFFEGLLVAGAYPLLSAILKSESSAMEGRALSVISDAIRWLIPGDFLTGAVLFFIFVVLVKNILNFVRDYFSFSFSQSIRQEYTNRVFERYILCDMEFMMEQKQGKVLNDILTSPSMMTVTFYHVPLMFMEALKLFIILGFLASISFPITMILLVAGAIFHISVQLISKKVSYLRAKEMVSSNEKSNVLVNEVLNGFQQVRIFGAEHRWITDLAKQNEIFRTATNIGQFFQLMPPRVIEVIALWAGALGILGLGYSMGDQASGALPVAGVFFLAVMRVLPSLSMIGNYWMTIASRLPYAEEVYSVLQLKTRTMADGHQILQEIGHITLSDVHYTYPSRDTTTIQGLSIDIAPMKMTALVGESGSGKSTIVNLLVGLLPPSKGVITINGLPATQYKKSSVLEKIGFVSQDSFLFNDSILQNIRFGHDCDDNSIIEAAKLANAHEFIIGLPKQYQTLVGDRGMKLSGGQRQRLSIARAIVRKPQLLIFDEATSALDNVSEALVQQSIRDLSMKYTVVVIAHRLDTIKNADHIVVLKGGSTQESGTHNQLMANNGEYARIYGSIN